MKKIYYRDWDEIPIILTVAQCALVMQVSERTITDWAIAGKLKASKIGGYWRITKDDLKMLFERRLTNV